MTCSIHLTPRCRRPARGQVNLLRLLIDADGAQFTLQARHFRTDSAPGSRAVYATDRRASPDACGVLLTLAEQPHQLVTTAIWRTEVPGEPARESRHVVHWLLPAQRALMVSDDTWLWPELPDTPRLSPGDWPVLDTAPAPFSGVTRRGLTIIDTRNREGSIIRRFQTFPLVALAPQTRSVRIPEFLTPLT